MISLVIIEDEVRTRAFLKSLISESYPWIEILGEADGVSSGVKLIREKTPDIVLLDVEMQDGNGFDLLDRLNDEKQLVIFITAYNQYAIKAIKKSAFDYLEKPVNPEELSDALYRAKAKLKKDAVDHKLHQYHPQTPFRISVPTRSGALYLESNDICYAKADGSYCEIFLVQQTKPIVVSRRLKELQVTLEHFGFIRPNHSYLVNILSISEVKRTDGGSIILKDGTEITFSKHYRNDSIAKLEAQAKKIGQK